MRKVTRPDSGHLYAMKVLKKATLKGKNSSLERTEAGLRVRGEPRPQGYGASEGGASVFRSLWPSAALASPSPSSKTK